MKTIIHLLLFSLIGFYSAIAADAQEKSGMIEAEYQGKKIDFPLLKSDYHVDIQGDLATVKLVQVFKNPTKAPLNATYLFPLNKDAAVYAMQMRVGDEVIEAKIRTIEQAKQEFEQAKQVGKAASLLEQHRPNMFTQKLANLMPGMDIHVTLKYTQHVSRIDAHYELILPLLVGPRYNSVQSHQINSMTNGASQHSTKVEVTSSTSFGQWELQTIPDPVPTMGIELPKSLEQERVDITVNLNAGMPVQSVTSPSHAIDVQPGDSESPIRSIRLSKGRVVDNRDFVLRYRLSGKDVKAGLMTHGDDRGNYFSLLIEPPAIPAAKNITPREMVFVLDTSGSMDGQPLDASKAFMRHALKHLRKTDYFRIIDFGNSPREFSQQPLAATQANLKMGLDHVHRLQASGGTEIVPAIDQAFAPLPAINTMRIVVFLTDGYIGNEADVLSRIHQRRGDARIYALGVGSSVNRYLLDEMGRAGLGFARYIDPTKDVQDTAIQFANRLETPVLTDIAIDWGTLATSEVTPKIIPDLFVGDSLRILGKFNPDGAQSGEHIVKVQGKVNGQVATLPLTLKIDAGDVSQNKSSESIALIWARSQIAESMRSFQSPRVQAVTDMQPEQAKQRIIKLGLEYSLMTRWTSFIAVSKQVVNTNPSSNKGSAVPLPMPAGVSEKAYSSSMHVPVSSQSGGMQMAFAGSSAPEPSMVKSLLLLLLVLGFLGAYRYRRLMLNS